MLGANSERPTGKKLWASLAQAMQADLVKRMANGHRLILSVGPPIHLHRLKDDADPSQADTVTLAQLFSQPDKWRVIAELSDLARMLLNQVADLQALEDWGVATMAQVASDALFYAQRLLAQLGHSRDAELDPWHFRDAAPTACLVKAHELHHGCAARVVDSIRSCIVAGTGPPAMGRLTLQRRHCIRVEWLKECGRPLGHESLRQFLRRATLPVLCTIAGESGDLAERRRDCEEALRRRLAAGEQRVERAMQIACTRKVRVGLRLATAWLKGNHPASVWLEVDPNGRNYGCSAAALLSVHRPHNEFVLEGPPPESALYYFPPCILVARLVFTAKGVTVANPLVRQPKGGYPWMHPYTGTLGQNPLPTNVLLDEYEPAWRGASEAAIALFPRLRDRLGVSAEGDMCLSNQQERLQELIRVFSTRAADIESADVLSLIDGLHQIAKLGLTRGHQLNTATPRARPEQMLYRLPHRNIQGLDAPFAQRVYPYDPRVVPVVR